MYMDTRKKKKTLAYQGCTDYSAINEHRYKRIANSSHHVFFFFLSIFRGISFLQNPRARRRGNGFESLSVQIHHLHAQMSIERHFIACAVSHSLHLQSDISNISFVLLTSRMSKRFRSNSAFCKTKSREKKNTPAKIKSYFYA